MAGAFPPNPSELLGQPIFKEMLQVMKEKFDYIIVDAPPVMAAIDAAVIAAVCDGTVLIVGSKKTSRKLVQESISQLNMAGANILGSILNMVETGVLTSKYGRYYGKYKYGYGYGYAPAPEREDYKEEEE